LIAAAASNALYTRPDGEILPLDKRAAAPSHNIAPDYFKTWGIPILAGRDFDQHDVADHQNVMLISQAGARKVFGNENPIGKTLLVSSGSIPVEIIGVVGDVRTRSIAKLDEVEIYRPWAQENFQFAVIGVRSALGAQAADVLRLVVKQGMTPVIIGLVVGLAAALALGRLLTAQLYGVSAHNPALLAATSVMFAIVALLACLIPARRASLVNPIEALRAE